MCDMLVIAKKCIIMSCYTRNVIYIVSHQELQYSCDKQDMIEGTSYVL